MNIFWLIVLAGLCALLYRLGGKQGYNTKFRDAGCPLIALIALWLLVGFQLSSWWAYLLFYGVMFGALTTYWDWLFKNRDNLYMHGLGIGLSAISLIWDGVAWYAIIGRVIVLSLSFGLLNKYINKWQISHSDEWEEYSRGALIILTIPILKI